MNAPECLNHLLKKCLRGCLIFKLLWLVSIIVCGACMFFPETRPWAGMIFMLCIALGLGLKHVRDRYHLLKHLSNNTEAVYWVQHPPAAEDALTKKVLAGKECLRLHMSSGHVLDVEIEKNETNQLRNWLDQGQNKPYWGLEYVRNEHTN